MQMLRNLQRRENMFVVKLGVFPCSQQPRNLEDVLDLATVHVQACEIVQLFGSDDMFLWRVVQEVLPDRAARGDGEFFVVERDMDARGEGRVESVDAVGG